MAASSWWSLLQKRSLRSVHPTHLGGSSEDELGATPPQELPQETPWMR